MAGTGGHFLNTPFVQMKNNAAAKQFDQRSDQSIPVKDFACWYNRKIYQGWPEADKNAAKPEKKTYHVHHFQWGYFTNITQCLAKMQWQGFYLILQFPIGIVNCVLIHYGYPMNRRRKLNNE